MKRTLRESQVEKLLGGFIRKLPQAESEDELQRGAMQLLEFLFKNGKGRTGTNSKNYTGKSLEMFCAHCVSQAIRVSGLRGAEVNADYIRDKEERFDDLRMDLNVFVGGKLVLMQESRAWVDKPFCTLKYQVIEDVIYLPHSRAVIADDIVFPVVAFCRDITERTLSTRDFFLNMVLRNSSLQEKTSYGGERVRMFQLSAGKRADGYFNAGINEADVAAYLACLHEHFAHFRGRK